MAKIKYQPGQSDIYKVSRTQIEAFVQCPRCTILNHRFGVKPPSGPPFNINSAVDSLLKTEFDVHRAAGTVHPIVAEAGLSHVPFAHDQLDKWRANFTGVQALHQPTNLLVFGAVDDIWVNSDGQLIVVDYKATAKKEQVTEVGTDGFHAAYRRQLDVYQWLLRQNGFDVSPTAYWLYCTGIPDAPAFNKRVEFRTALIPYEGDTGWIEPVLLELKAALDAEELPASSESCEICSYFEKRVLYSHTK